MHRWKDAESTGRAMSVMHAVKKTPPRSRIWQMWTIWFAWFLFMVCAGWLLQRSLQANVAARPCVAPWPTSKETDKKLKVCITTMSDAQADSIFHDAALRDFSDVLDATWSNRMAYAMKHNYILINASELIDVQRPPAWSKILAVYDAMSTGCDWVFWTDPDSLIMNSEIRLEDILPSDPHANLLITKDATGYNAGMWLMRNCRWSTDFLSEWWSMTGFIRKPGDSRSGDNDALKVFLNEKEDTAEHVYVAPQCLFNSYVWNPRLRNLGRYLWDKDWVMARGLYKEGDFAVHFAGIDDKMQYIEEFRKKTA